MTSTSLQNFWIFKNTSKNTYSHKPGLEHLCLQSIWDREQLDLIVHKMLWIYAREIEPS